MEDKGGVGAKGMCHNPLGVRGPLMMMFPFLMICTLNFEKIAAQSSSQSLPMEIRDPVERPLRT